MSEPTNHPEMLNCEACRALTSLKDAIYSEGCSFCPGCWAAWLAEFNACEHEWQEHYNEYGEKGRCCKQCSGFVADERVQMQDEGQ